MFFVVVVVVFLFLLSFGAGREEKGKQLFIIELLLPVNYLRFGTSRATREKGAEMRLPRARHADQTY